MQSKRCSQNQFFLLATLASSERCHRPHIGTKLVVNIRTELIISTVGYSLVLTDILHRDSQLVLHTCEGDLVQCNSVLLASISLLLLLDKWEKYKSSQSMSVNQS